MESYYINILEELVDFNEWCISDKSAWGIPIPFFINKNNSKILIDQEIVEYFAQQVDHFGTSDIWYNFEVVDLLPPRYKDQASELTKGFEVFDSWFDTSLSWNYVLN